LELAQPTVGPYARVVVQPENDEIPAIASLYLATEIRWGGPGGTPVAPHDAYLDGVAAHVITAWNPGDERPSLEANHAADCRLRDRLESAGFAPRRVVGADPHSDHFEESWLVAGLSDDAARSIGAEFGQVAVFRIAGGQQTVLACSESWSVSRSLR
jgi:hypothetical protein